MNWDQKEIKVNRWGERESGVVSREDTACSAQNLLCHIHKSSELRGDTSQPYGNIAGQCTYQFILWLFPLGAPSLVAFCKSVEGLWELCGTWITLTLRYLLFLFAFPTWSCIPLGQFIVKWTKVFSGTVFKISHMFLSMHSLYWVCYGRKTKDIQVQHSAAVWLKPRIVTSLRPRWVTTTTPMARVVRKARVFQQNICCRQ